jgi:transposase
MKQKSGPDKAPADQVLKDIRRQTRRQCSAEEKIRIVLEGLRGEESISEHCRREGIAASMYYGWSKEFLEAGKRRLAGDTARAATSDEVKSLRRESTALKEVVADLTLENRLLKKSMTEDGQGYGEDGEWDTPHPRRPRSSSWWRARICRPSAHWISSAFLAPPSIAGRCIVTAALS